MNVLKKMGALCLLLVLALTAQAQGDVTAVWDFQNDLPAGIQESTNYQKVEADIPSTVDGISMHVNALNGKLYCVGRNNAQFNAGTILQIPVKSTKDIVTVVNYPKYNNYTVGGEAPEGDEISHKATAAEVAQGFAEVVATGGCYLYRVQVVHVSSIQEKTIYSTDFSTWKKQSAATKESTVTEATKYSHENLTFTLYNTAVDPAGINSKFNNGEALGWLQANKAADPYVLTSPLASITKVFYVHGATGSNRGWKLEAKGDGDADWVVLHDAVANPAGWCEVNVDVNRTNVQLRWTNLDASQNAYMFRLDIMGNVDFSQSPSLGELKVNDTKYAADDIFTEDASGKMVATIEISKAETMISEENPLTGVTTNNGEITSTVYSKDEKGNAVVTITVQAGEAELVYILTVVYKPDFTLTYVNTDGTTLATQTVEKDAVIGTFAKGAEDVTVAEGKKFRGWFVKADGGRKYTVDEVITKDIKLYAVATDIETMSPVARYYYNLGDIYFYPEDHEAFNLIGTGTFHDNQHGWTVNSGDKLQILVGGHAYVVLGLCRYGSASTITLSDAEGNALATATAPVESDGQSAAFEYHGEAGTLTFSCDNGIYLHNLTIINDAEKAIAKNEEGYFVVRAGDADNLLATIEVANAQANNESRTLIFVPDGTYDLGTKCLTNISGNNISLIGQSMEKTIIRNAPLVDNEGIGTTATILVTGKNTYFQDLTLQNALDYYASGSAGRAVCLQDKGARTICTNVKMLSYQDTYYSNAASQFYWETSEIHGTVDFICGGGDVFFNKCLLVGESRKQGEKNGEVTITAPYTDASNTFGYVFDGCTIENRAASFNFGRAWGGVPRLAFLNTTLNQPNEIASKRFTAAGMNVAADKFVEYRSVDKDGNVVSPATNVVTFTKDSQQNKMETILTEEQAADYSLDKVFTDWTPAALAAQLKNEEVKVADGTITWNAVEGALAYAIFSEGELKAIVDAKTTSFAIADDAKAYTVRVANAMGGFGEETVAAATPTGIDSMQSDHAGADAIYTIQGVRVNKAEAKGLYIINGKKQIK